MTAYMVFVRDKTFDADEMTAYTPLAGESLAGHPIEILAAYGPHEVLEGPDIEGAVIVSFPSVAEAKAWYESPAYRAAREHRFRGAVYRAFLIEGL